MELLAPVGSPETVEAAVQSGANAVYLGYGDFNARRNAKNFSLTELEEAIGYCHIRGVSVFLTLNTLLRQRELPQVESLLRTVLPLGIDAVIVQDLALVSMIQQLAPSVEIHASTQCTIHSLEGVYQAQELGFHRVVLSRELSGKEMAYIAQRSPLPLEVFVHGAMCMSYSGQCFLSAMVGERSGNRGVCAQPCRLDYGWNGSAPQGKFPLSLKDMSLGKELQELQKMGIASLKIEGRMKRPEYVAVVTGIYARAIAEGRSPTKEEEQALEQAFSRQGFTNGYYKGVTGNVMFGTRQSQPEPKDLFADARRSYQGKEQVKIPVHFSLRVEESLDLTLTDPEGNRVTGTIPEVQTAQNKELTPEVATAQLQRTGGTPYTLIPEEIHIASGLALPLSQLNHLRRDLLEQLSQARLRPMTQALGEVASLPTYPKESRPLQYTVSVAHPAQITPELLACRPAVVYLPLETSEERVAFCQEQGVSLCLSLPSILSDQERGNLAPMVERFRQWGVEDALVGTLDSYHWGKSMGFRLRGDYGLNLYNDHSLGQYGDLLSAMPSFELTLPQIRDLQTALPLELMAYGNLPLMTTKNCMIKNQFGNDEKKKKSPCKGACKGACSSGSQNRSGVSLYDRKKKSFPVESVTGGRNMVYNGLPLYLADKDLSQLGLWALRLYFTRESPDFCQKMLRQYQQPSENHPKEFTRGLYYRGVD